MKISRIFVITTFFLLAAVSIFGQRLVVDPAFSPNINGSVDFVEVLPDQKILIAGHFTAVDGQSRLKIARLNANGSLDPTFDANWVYGSTSNLNNVRVKALTVQPDGKVYISGSFASSGTNVPDKILRLNSDGSLDQSLTTIPLIEGADFVKGIRKIQPLPDGKFMACGYFSTANGNAKSFLARFNSDGSFDSTLTTQINKGCYDVAVQPDGKYLVAGIFTTVNGSPRQGLVRFDTNDSVDTSFTAYSRNNQFNPDTYLGIKLLDDGTMYVFYEAVYEYILQLNANGSLRTMFLADVNPADAAADIEVLPNGKILAIGDFFTAGNTVTQSDYFNRFTPDGRHDGSVRVDFFGANPGTKAVELAADEKIIVGGAFTSVRTNGVTVSKNYLVRLAPQAVPIKHKYDFDGDGKDDLAVFRPNDRVWYINQSTNGYTSAQFGLSTDKPVAADYDGDGKTDIAVFRDGVWYWMRSSNNTFAYGITGQAGDIPQGGFKGRFYLRGTMLPDGTPGLLTFRPSEAAFYLQNPYEQPHSVNLQGMTVTSGDIPVSADYDGDEYEDVAVFRDGYWSYLSSNDSGVWNFRFGLAGDKPVIGDFDGDGRTDYAVFRPSTGVWWIQKSTEGLFVVKWGLSDDLPVPADYDGDGKTDIAVYRDGVWYILKSTGSYHIEQYGLPGDIPAQLKP
jgi:uncharacterized delta-60 repeat protein